MRTVAVFPGQGSQHIGMGKSLIDNFAVAARTFEEASDSVGFDVKRLCLDGPEEALKATEFTQPCLLTTSVAAYRSLVETSGFSPSAVAGHSLGEYSALVSAGAIRFSDAVKWVHARGQAMQKAVPQGTGGMTAVLGLSETEVRALCQAASTEADPVEPANFNSPGQIVVSGTLAGLARLPEVVATQKLSAKLVPLPVSAPFHCSLMAPTRAVMEPLLTAALGTLTCPYVSNVDASFNDHTGNVYKKLLAQLDHAVLWQQSMELLLGEEPTAYVECGPGAVLQGLGKRIAKAESAKRKIEARWTGASDLESVKAFGGQS